MALLLGALTGSAQVPDWVQSTNAVEFFTNLSSRLLSASGYAFDANSVPVYTNNTFVFSPDVHRILQVAANIYDAETNHHYAAGHEVDLPTVLRPTFRRQVEGSYTNIYIGGYVEVGAVTGMSDPQFSVPLDMNDDGDRAVAGSVPDQNIYDVPWIFGVKKGFPNFNEFAMQSVAQITRMLQVRRATLSSPPIATNQLFVVGISNVFAFEAWNSYQTNYGRAVQILAASDLTIGLNFTNDCILDQRGGNISVRIIVSAITNLDGSAWAGYGNDIANPINVSFVLPLQTNITFLPDSYFRAESNPAFTTNLNLGANLFQGFEQTGRFINPQFNLSVSNRIRFILIDSGSGRVIDHIQLSGLNGMRDLSAELPAFSTIFIDGTTGFLRSESIFWQTNRLQGNASIFAPSLGVINQLYAALGVINVPDWNSLGFGQTSTERKQKQIDSFRVFCGLNALYFPGTVNTDLVAVVPFTPSRKTSQYLSWQANDPLVHFTRQDLTCFNLGNGNGITREWPNGGIEIVKNIGRVNHRFEPWGGHPVYGLSSGVSLFDAAFKDPLVRSSDEWDFAARGELSVAWLGKVHRGTPWQTLYLKSGEVEVSKWSNWTGWDVNLGLRGRPVNDRAVFVTLATLLNTNSPADLLSINSADTNAWAQALNGLVVYTNTSSDVVLTSTPPTVIFGTNVMSSASPQASVISGGILQTRGGTTWTSVGDILSTPELSEGSPWLNTNSYIQLQHGISEEAYEAVAAQLLPRLRQDSVGGVASVGELPTIEFSGYDGFPYAVEVSGDLVHWMTVSTNYPVNGKWSFVDPPGVEAGQRFYRSRLLP